MTSYGSLAVLGSTGSIGTQALEVAGSEGIPVGLLTGGTNVSLIEQQARRLRVPRVAMADPASARDLATRLADTPTRVYSGREGILDAIRESECATVLNAISGEAGLLPTLTALACSDRLALANKESMVVAGEIVRREADAHGCELIPVDSEHSAIFQCLKGGRHSEVKRLLLTASGGPFFGYTPEQLERVTVADALAHPTWNMGRKITVDSATLLNKGLEIIEAVRLFDIPADRITVLVHKQSIIHSAVEYIDNAVIAQLGAPDMRTCIAYALTYPHRTCGISRPLDLFSVGELTFAPADEDTFPLLACAKRAVTLGGAVPAVLNAAGEVATDAFLRERLSFVGISRAVVQTVEHFSDRAASLTSLDDILGVADLARTYTHHIIQK